MTQDDEEFKMTAGQKGGLFYGAMTILGVFFLGFWTRAYAASVLALMASGITYLSMHFYMLMEDAATQNDYDNLTNYHAWNMRCGIVAWITVAGAIIIIAMKINMLPF